MNVLNLFEANIVLWIQENLRVGFLTPIVQAITVLGDSGIFWIVLTILLLIFKKTRRLGLCCACALLLDLLAVNIAIKPLVNRVRPYNVITDIVALTGQHGDPSFPSGHSAASFACAWVLFRMERKKWGVSALILAALISLSRLYVGVHYPTDVLGGILIGIAVGEAGMYLGKKVWNSISKKLRAE